MSPVWTMPTLLAVLSAIGIGAAILGDGVWDWLCWAALSVPVVVCLWKLWRQWPRRAGVRP